MSLYSVSELYCREKMYVLIVVQQKAKHRVSKHATLNNLCYVPIDRQSYVPILTYKPFKFLMWIHLISLNPLINQSTCIAQNGNAYIVKFFSEDKRNLLISNILFCCSLCSQLKVCSFCSTLMNAFAN